MTEMIPCRLNGKWDLTLPDHRAARPEWTTGWEVERLDAMHSVIQPGDTVVDVGAEEGDMSALCAQWAGPTGNMVLVEPNPKVWPNIRAIWEHNDDLAPVLKWFVGFAARTTDLDPPMNDVNEFWNGTAGHSEWPNCAYGPLIGDHGFRQLYQQADATPTTRLDHLVNGVDVITMDVEGSEMEVLAGARAILSTWKPVVFVSIHPQFMVDQFDTHPLALYDYMWHELGYKSEHLATDHEVHVVFWHPEARLYQP